MIMGGLFREEAERCLAFMPAVQGVVNWPLEEPNRTALVSEDSLPLPDACIDRVLAVHALMAFLIAERYSLEKLTADVDLIRREAEVATA